MGTIEAVDLTGLAAEECARAGAELVRSRPRPGLSGATACRACCAARPQPAGERPPLQRRPGDRSSCGARATCEVRVSDRGPGVPPAERERIFEPFYRLPGASERDGGVGLGLGAGAFHRDPTSR